MKCDAKGMCDELTTLRAEVARLRKALLDRIAAENGNDVPTRGDEDEMRAYLLRYVAPELAQPKGVNP